MVVIHTGAAQQVRVWPLMRYAELHRRIVDQGLQVMVICDHEQAAFWNKQKGVCWKTVSSIGEMVQLLSVAKAFIGNDSGPGHVAAALGVPTFTIFGNQRPEWFLPDHPLATYVPGKPCHFKPCFDRCRFDQPFCLFDVSFDEVANRVEGFLKLLNVSSKT